MLLLKIVKSKTLILLILGLCLYKAHESYGKSQLDHGTVPAKTDCDVPNTLFNLCKRYQQKLHDQKMAGQLGGCISHASFLAIKEDKEVIRVLLNQLLVDLPIEERHAYIEKTIQDMANQ
jgi:hypothetical protein